MNYKNIIKSKKIKINLDKNQKRKHPSLKFMRLRYICKDRIMGKRIDELN